MTLIQLIFGCIGRILRVLNMLAVSLKHPSEHEDTSQYSLILERI